MTSTYNPTGTDQTSAKAIQASDIKSLIQRQGKATINDKEVVLKSPAATDPKLQEIIKDPALTVKAVGSPGANGEREYELTANGKSVKIKVDCKSCH
jgi:hypothetical protein